jgi:alpha 1,2-mannosyltransferase
MAAVMFLTKDDIHYWENIGYRVADDFIQCPYNKALYSRCTCRPDRNFDSNGYSCMRFY